MRKLVYVALAVLAIVASVVVVYNTKGDVCDVEDVQTEEMQNDIQKDILGSMPDVHRSMMTRIIHICCH